MRNNRLRYIDPGDPCDASFTGLDPLCDAAAGGEHAVGHAAGQELEELTGNFINWLRGDHDEPAAPENTLTSSEENNNGGGDGGISLITTVGASTGSSNRLRSVIVITVSIGVNGGIKIRSRRRSTSGADLTCSIVGQEG